MQCSYIYIKGPRKGHMCPKIRLESSIYCQTHDFTMSKRNRYCKYVFSYGEKCDGLAAGSSSYCNNCSSTAQANGQLRQQLELEYHVKGDERTDRLETPQTALNLMDLPNEILLKIIDNTDLTSRVHLLKVNKRMADLAQHVIEVNGEILEASIETFRARGVNFPKNLDPELFIEYITHLSGYISFDPNNIVITKINKCSTVLSKVVKGRVYTIMFVNSPYTIIEEWRVNNIFYRKSGGPVITKILHETGERIYVYDGYVI
jgi:hypothetical protein